MRLHSSSLMLILHLDFQAYNCITLLLGSFISSELTSRETVQKFSKAQVCGDFPGGPVVKNPPSNAGHTGSIPSQGTQMHMPRETTPSGCNQSPGAPEPILCNQRSLHVPQLEKSPRTTTTIQHSCSSAHPLKRCVLKSQAESLRTKVAGRCLTSTVFNILRNCLRYVFYSNT